MSIYTFYNYYILINWLVIILLKYSITLSIKKIKLEMGCGFNKASKVSSEKFTQEITSKDIVFDTNISTKNGY